MLVQTALDQKAPLNNITIITSHRFQTSVMTLEYGVLLVLIKWFLNWQIDLDAFRSIRPEQQESSN